MNKKARLYALALTEAARGKSAQARARLVGRLGSLLRKNGMLKHAQRVLAELSALESEENGKPAIVVTPRGVPDRIRSRMEQTLASMGYRMEERHDPRVIGGVAVFLGPSFLADATVRGRLERIWRQHYGTRKPI